MLDRHSITFRVRLRIPRGGESTERESVAASRTSRVAFCVLWLAVCALMMACGAARSKAEAVGDSAGPQASESSVHASSNAQKEDQAEGARSEHAEADEAEVDAFGVPSGILRAQAWPETDDEGSWRALEQRQGSFVTTENSGDRTFVFSSLTDSMPAKGIFIEFPADLKPEEIPTLIAVSLSPTPIRITRDAWPAIEPLFRSVGVARIHAKPGQRIYLEFDEIERVSLLKLRLWTDAQRGRIGVGRVRLVYQRAQVNATAYQRIALTPLQDAETLPQDTGVLGTDESITLPHRKRLQ